MAGCPAHPAGVGVEADEQDIGAPAGRADDRAAVSRAKIEEYGRIRRREAVELTDVHLGEPMSALYPHVTEFTDVGALTVGRPVRHTFIRLSFETVTAFPSGVGRSFRASASRLL